MNRLNRLNYMRPARNYDKFIWFLTVLTITFFQIFNETENSSRSIILVTVVLAFAMFMDNKYKLNLQITYFHISIFLFVLFCYASSVWALDPVVSRTFATTILSSLLCFSVYFEAFKSDSSVDRLLKAVMWSGPIVAVYTILYFGYDEFVDMMNNSIRVENDFANANTLGMWMAICLSLFVFYILREGFKWRYLTAVLLVVIIAFSQSRTALIEAFVGSAMVAFFTIQKEKRGKRIIKYILVIVVGIVAINVISQLDIFKGLFQRMQGLEGFLSDDSVVNIDSSARTREIYIQLGWAQFLQTPIGGIGIGNTYFITQLYHGSTYLHNNYIELLAAGGILGFGLYYSIYVYLFINLGRDAIKYKNIYSEICCIMLAINLVADVGTVSYYKKQNIFLLMICFLQVYINAKKQNDETPLNKESVLVQQ